MSDLQHEIRLRNRVQWSHWKITWWPRQKISDLWQVWCTVPTKKSAQVRLWWWPRILTFNRSIEAMGKMFFKSIFHFSTIPSKITTGYTVNRIAGRIDALHVPYATQSLWHNSRSIRTCWFITVRRSFCANTAVAVSSAKDSWKFTNAAIPKKSHTNAR